jgi:hypothetical protein
MVDNDTLPLILADSIMMLWSHDLNNNIVMYFYEGSDWYVVCTGTVMMRSSSGSLETHILSTLFQLPLTPNDLSHAYWKRKAGFPFKTLLISKISMPLNYHSLNPSHVLIIKIVFPYFNW